MLYDHVKVSTQTTHFRTFCRMKIIDYRLDSFALYRAFYIFSATHWALKTVWGNTAGAITQMKTSRWTCPAHKKLSINIHCVNHRVESGDQPKLFVQELWPPTIYTQRDGPADTTPTALPYTYRPVITNPPSLSTPHSHPFPQETLISPPIGNSC